MIAGGSKAKAATKLLGDGKEKAKKVSRQKLLPGSKEDNSLPGSKKSKPSSSLIKRPRLSITKIKPVKPSTQKEGTFDMDKLDDLLKSLVENTESLKKVTKKDVKDEKKKSENKDRVKQKVKVKRREEKTEAVKEGKDVEKKSGISLPKTPDFLKGIFESIGRLTLSVGIMALLNVLTDPEKRESIFNFLSENIDKIVLGMLGIIAITFATSFLPVIGMVGVLLSIMTPVVATLVGILVSPPVLAALTLAAAAGAGYVIPKVLPETVNEQERKIDQAPGTKEEKIKALKEQLKNLNWFDRYIRGMGSEIEEQIHRLETGQTKSYGEDFGQAGDPLYKDGDEKRETSTEDQESTTRPMVKPQTPVVGDTNLGAASGDSGSARYSGRGPRAPLAVPITPFLESDISGQGISIISGFGERFGRMHKGYDLPAAEGTPLHAYLPGVITRNMSNVNGYGNLIEWKDDVYGQTHMFAHMQEPSPLRPGTKFKAGAVLGKVGNTDGGTGISEGPHLHWEIGRQGSEVDPGEWLQKHPINVAPSSSPPKDQKVSYQTEYERSGVQVAMVQVPVPMPVETPISVGGGGGSSSSSGSSVNTYSDLFLASRYSEA